MNFSFAREVLCHLHRFFRCGQKASGLLVVALAAWTAACSSAEKQSEDVPLEPVDDFRLLDHQGLSHSLYYLSDQPGILFVAVEPDCADLPAVFERMATLVKAHPEAVPFFVHASLNEQRDRFGALLAEAGLDVPVLMDTSLTVARSLHLKQAGDAVLVDPKMGDVRLLARGDDSCPLEAPNGKDISYEKDIVPIVAKRCLECHHKDREVGVWTSYDRARGWSAMIRQVLRTQRMPPGGHDAYYGQVAGGHTTEEIATLLQWVEADMPRTEKEDPLSVLNDEMASATAAALARWGSPSRVWEMKTSHKLPESGPDQYLYADLAGPLEEDIFVNRIRMDLNVQVTHHVNLLVLDAPLNALDDSELISRPGSDMVRVRKVKGPKGKMYKEDEKDPSLMVSHKLYDETILMTYGRSKRTLELDEGQAVRIPKGSYLAVEIHYGLTGKEEENRVRVEVFEHDASKAMQEVKRGCLYRGLFKIPPKDKRFTMKTAVDLQEDITLLEVVPHMHRRGSSARYIAEYPDGRLETVISIPFFQYKYQPQWKLAEPVFLPKGTRLTTEMIYDNSAQNPINPDPEEWVENGSKRIQEMHLPRFYYVDGRIPDAGTKL